MSACASNLERLVDNIGLLPDYPAGRWKGDLRYSAVVHQRRSSVLVDGQLKEGSPPTFSVWRRAGWPGEKGHTGDLQV